MAPPDPMKERLLVVDDAPDAVEILQRNLSQRGYEVLTASGVNQAIGILEQVPIELVITDLKMPGPSGLELVRHVREHHKTTEVIMITGYATVSGAVEAMKTGAGDYLSKPFTDKELFDAVGRALEKLRLQKRMRALSSRYPDAPFGLIGESTAMARVRQAVVKAASLATPVLITGERGTGREAVARGIHYGGDRALRSFITVDCGRLPGDPLERELFGEVDDTPSGSGRRMGFFQMVEGGSVYLNEIGELTPEVQLKLVRTIRDRQAYPAGSDSAQSIDVRILASTSRDLTLLADKAAFREDLLERVAAQVIPVPPLRERAEDVLLLADYFLKKFSAEIGRPGPAFSDQAKEAMKSYPWPGNISELENAMLGLATAVEAEIVDLPDLPSAIRSWASKDVQGLRSLVEVEQEYIRHVLSLVGDNKTRAAEILGIDRKTLREKLKGAG